MRDDLHRGAPVAPCWRTVVKRFASDAVWEVEGPRALEQAIAKDANELLNNLTLRRLHEIVAAGNVPMPGIGPDLWFGKPLSALERNAARSVMRALSGGTADSQTVERAVSIALTEHVREVGRQISAHLHSKASRSKAEFMQRFRTFDSGERIARAVRSRVAGERATVRQPRHHIGLDSHIGA
jgi:hypothetical protein